MPTSFHKQRAKAAPDPLVKKRKQGDEMSDCKRQKSEELPLLDRLKNSTTPYWKLPYPEQVYKLFIYIKVCMSIFSA